MKKIMIISLSLVILLLVGCTNEYLTTKNNTVPADKFKQTPSEGNSWDYWDDERYDDGEVITVDWYVNPKNFNWSGFTGTIVSDTIERKTGCKINYSYGGGDPQKLSTMIAGNKLPDVVTVEVSDSSRTQLATQKYIYSINDLAEKWAPNMLTTYSMEIQTWFKESDGKLYGCPQLFYTEEDLEDYAKQGGYIIPNRVMCARRDLVNWYMEKYPEDYKTITTPDGLIKFIKTCIQDKTSNYTTDTKKYSAVQIAPWTATSESETISLLCEYFAVPRENIEGNLVDKHTTEQYKEVLLFLNRLYREGLITEAAMSETEGVGANIQNGRPVVTMVTPQNYQNQFYNYNKQAYNVENPDEGSDYIPILITNQAGDTPVINNLVGSGYMFSMITTNCKRPDRVIKLFDYLNSDEGQMLMLYGAEHVTYEWDVRPGETDSNGVYYKYGKIRNVDSPEVLSNIAKGLATTRYGRLQIFTNRMFNHMTSDTGFTCDTLTSYLLFNQKAAMTPFSYNPKLFGRTSNPSAPNYQKMVTISNNIKSLWLQRVAEIASASSEAGAISKLESALKDAKNMGQESLLEYENANFQAAKREYNVDYVWAPLKSDYNPPEVKFLGYPEYNLEIPSWVWEYAN